MGDFVRGKRFVAGAASLACLLSLGGGAWAARHDAAASASAGAVSARAWVEVADGRAGAGQHLDIRPDGAGDWAASPVAFLVPEGLSLDAGPHLPDLVPLPAWDVYVDTTDSLDLARNVVTAVTRTPPPRGPKALRFAATIANVGRHSLEIVGIPRPTGDPDEAVRVDARQCVRFVGPRIADAERVCLEYRPVGSLIFHPEHGHFHIDGFAQYRLLRDAAGRPDDSPAGVVTASEKVGFCMGDTDWQGAGDMVVDTGWYRECRHTAPHVPVTARQGVSPGWADSYGSLLPGQHLLLDGVADGVYWVAISVNPVGVPGAVNIFETDRANNTSYRKIELSHGGTQVREL